MKKNLLAVKLTVAVVAAVFLFSNTALAYWVWTPGTKKFINPKNAVKDSPKEQFEWGMTFYDAKDYQRASTEFDKLVKQYEYSEYASRAQYYSGLCYENMNKLYIAFQNYQKAIDNFPHIENIDEIVAREFNIANSFMDKSSPKILGTDIMTSTDRAIEIYKKVVENAPYGKLADEAQFNMGAALKKAERYDEAIQAFQKILDDYPTSPFVDKSKFDVADCAYKASLKPAYDAEPTEKAIKAFEDFSRENRDRSLSKEAEKTIQRLRDKSAEKSLLTAQFYEKLGRRQSAIIYYKDIVYAYPDSSFVQLARSKVEVLTARLEKSNASPALFKFTKPAPKIAKTPAVESEAPKAKAWTPFVFSKPAKPKEAAPKIEKKAKSAKAKLWNPFSRPPRPEREAVKRADSKRWTPFVFSKPTKPKEAAQDRKVVVEAKPSEEAPPEETDPAAEPERPSEITVTADEAEVKKAEPKSGSYSEIAKEMDLDEQVEKSEY
ncbi:MAG: tetratricopeptide repeat protein [Candidatus Omnitrophota bacterium]|nr:tetratricopeptide repeat protein [Candidatus Omnitrophota bacterium]